MISIQVSQILSKSEIYGAITAMRKLPEIRDQRSEDIISIILTVNKGWDLTIRKSDAGIIPSRICREDSAGTHGLPRISRRTHGLDENISLGRARQVDTVRSVLIVRGLQRAAATLVAAFRLEDWDDLRTRTKHPSTRRDHLTRTRLAGIISPGQDLAGSSYRDATYRDTRWETEISGTDPIDTNLFGPHREGATTEGQRPT